MLARDTASGAEGLFTVDLSPDPARQRFRVLAFETADDATRFAWLLRSLQRPPGSPDCHTTAGLMMGSDNLVSFGPMQPKARRFAPPALLRCSCDAHAHALTRAPAQDLLEEASRAGRAASVLRRGELSLRPGQSADELLGKLMETAGADDLLEHFRQQIRAGKL